jgi:hypothetical protein
MKPLDLPLGLRMPHAPMQEANALIDQEDAELRQPGRMPGVPPGVP